MLELGLDKYLELHNLDKIVLCNDIIGIWSQIDASSNYPFSKIENDNIKKISEMLNLGIDNYTVYKYGLYVSSVVAGIKKISYKEINDMYKKLPIYTRKEIKINGEEIIKILGKEPGNYIKEIMTAIEKKIINLELKNDKEAIIEYIKQHYGG